MAVAAADGRPRLGVHDNDAAVSEASRQVATVRGEVHRVDKGGIEQLRKRKCFEGCGGRGDAVNLCDKTSEAHHGRLHCVGCNNRQCVAKNRRNQGTFATYHRHP